MICWIRRVVGLALLGWSAWTILRPLTRSALEPEYGIDHETGAAYGIRINPLTPWEAARARALEATAIDEWLQKR